MNREVGLGEHVVRTLTDHLKHKHHHVFFDNFFTSVHLLHSNTHYIAHGAARGGNLQLWISSKGQEGLSTCPKKCWIEGKVCFSQTIPTWSNVWQLTTCLAVEQHIPVTKPCIAGRQIHQSNTPAQKVEEYWRLNLFYPFIEQLIVELQDRLCKPMSRLKAQYILPSHIANLSTEAWQDIKNEYDSLIPHPSIVDVQLEGWKHAINSGAVKAESLQEAVFAAQFMFPNIHTILKVLLTMPVSAATAERSFSCLRC